MKTYRIINKRFLAPLLLSLLVYQIPTKVRSQELNGATLLDKAIAYHDPHGAWASFHGQLNIKMETPQNSDRISTVIMDLPAQYFKLITRKDQNTIEQTLQKEDCTLALNGSTEISDEAIKTHKLSCERAVKMKDYYTYLYGLPMKLKDPGTLLDSKVQRKTFKGKEYLVLKVTYEETVGKDSWYFYFDPVTFALEVYQFYHDESKNDGEYILLNEELEVSGIKMPKVRAWYYNKNDQYLGTDILTGASSL